MPRWPLTVTLALALAACGSEGADAPSVVSPGEAKALDEVAEMLEERRLPPEALPTEAPSDAPPATAPAELPDDAAPAAR